MQVEGSRGFPGAPDSMQPDVQFEWEAAPARLHAPHRLVDNNNNNNNNNAPDLGFDMDRHLVTNAQCVRSCKKRPRRKIRRLARAALSLSSSSFFCFACDGWW